MQRCPNCGEINYDDNDYCINCGEEIYITVEPDEMNTPDNYNTEAEDFLNELLVTPDNDDEFSEETDLENKEDAVEEFTRELFNDENIFREEPKKEVEIMSSEDVKYMIKRNKNLENDLGMHIRNIDIIVHPKRRNYEVIGEVRLNKDKQNNVKLSILEFNDHNQQVHSYGTIIEIKEDKYEVFNIVIESDLENASKLILMPKLLKKAPKDLAPEKINQIIQNTPKKKPHPNIFIEQIKDIERKIGMKISNTSIIIKSVDSLEIVGEIHIKNPKKYDTINIVATCYDRKNNIIFTQTNKINTQLFLGFDTLQVKVNGVEVDEIERIKVYPTLQ